jgi:hypothetical protein
MHGGAGETGGGRGIERGWERCRLEGQLLAAAYDEILAVTLAETSAPGAADGSDIDMSLSLAASAGV